MDILPSEPRLAGFPLILNSQPMDIKLSPFLVLEYETVYWIT